MDELERARLELKNKKKVTHVKKYNWHIFTFMNQFCITIILTLLTLIILKSNSKLKQGFYKHVYEDNFSFSEVNELYKKYFGSSIPFKDFFVSSTPVFNEELIYTEASIYMDGVKLTVDNQYLVPNQLSGLVVFIGEKEGYGNTVIIQQANGIDLWYGNIEDVSVKLYDYVEQGDLIGNTKDTNLYLVYKKDGEVLNYEDYI